MTLPPEAYLWFKTLHIIGVVVWFAGLFYLVRLFIYHIESNDFDETADLNNDNVNNILDIVIIVNLILNQ